MSGWNEYLDAATNTYDAVKNVASFHADRPEQHAD
ncbi:hypothetical protein [Enterobacter sp. MGH 14]|nr:hypothetical protein [Enterobacter sp. MGH 14]